MGTVGIYIHYYLLFPCSDFVSQMWGGCNVFLTFYAISNISRKKFWEYKPIISHLMFSSCFFLYAGNIEKCPFTYSYWLNGRWFLQIVDIGHFIMKLEILKSAPSLTGYMGEVVSPNRRYTCREFEHEVNWKVVSPDSR